MILKKILGKFSHDIGIDLGTANTLVYVRGKGIVINEPSVVSINKKTGHIVAIGLDAQKMVGKTPEHIVAMRPLVNGVISDFEVTEKMLAFFIRKVHPSRLLFNPSPRVVIGIPSGCTEVEKKSVEDAARNAGAREVHLVEEPMAAAIGSRLPIHQALGNMIVDIGGGTTEIAVISLGGVVVKQSLRIAGDRLNNDVIRYARTEFNLLIGERMAEAAKIAVGSAVKLDNRLETSLRGRDLLNGLPKEIQVSDTQIRKAINHSLKILVTSIKHSIETTPPELVADIMKNGIILAGGGALLRGLDALITQETQILCKVTDDPLTVVARGTGIILEELDKMKNVLA